MTDYQIRRNRLLQAASRLYATGNFDYTEAVDAAMTLDEKVFDMLEHEQREYLGEDR